MKIKLNNGKELDVKFSSLMSIWIVGYIFWAIIYAVISVVIMIALGWY